DADVGRSIETFRSPFLEFDPASTLAQSMQGNSILEEETVDAAGTAWLIRAVSYPNRQGAVLTIINIGRLRDAEAEARSNGVMLSALGSITGAFYLETDNNFSRVEKELGYRNYIGIDEKGAGSLIDPSIYHPEDAPTLKTALKEAKQTGNLDCTIRLRQHSAGHYHYVRLVGEQQNRGGAHEADGWHLTGIDVHDLMTSARAARDQEAILSAVLKASPTSISYIDNHETFVYVNDAFEQSSGLLREDIIGKKMQDILSTDEYETAQAHIDAALAGTPTRYVEEVVLPDGRLQRFSMNYEPVYFERRVGGFTVHRRDITRFHSQAQEITHTDQLLANATRIAQYAVCLVDVQTGIVEFANKNAKKRLGVEGDKELPEGTQISR
ncbi:MAG: PAS domain S-box protein, partial [Pseudomonadota bacterium]